MKIILSLLISAALLAGCSNTAAEVPTAPPSSPETAPVQQTHLSDFVPPAYVSRFDTVTEITLSDDGISVDGGQETAAVYTTRDIIYYENRDSYDSGNPYGEGTHTDKHTAEEAAAHTVVNITSPGAYRITGKLSAGQIRIDLGEDTHKDPNAVVELILSDADITCTVAPAILFRNTYECDNNWSAETATPDVDTSTAGANLVLEGKNIVNGSYVAKIYKDKEGEKKLWKQDGAIYSYMSMNVFGPGSLELKAANEGLDTELHLTINGGSILIHADNDGINTNEDGVSVTTINGGNLTIYAGLGAEGDGIDSNGYLVINGGTVFSCAKPVSDAGMDSDLGSFVHGGTVIAMGSTMDWAESNSRQVTMNLQFASQLSAGSKITITTTDGKEIFSFEDNGQHARGFSGLVLSHAAFLQGETYHIYVDGQQMAYIGTDVGGFPGGFGGPPGNMPEGFDPGRMPDGFDPSQMDGNRGERPMDGNFPPREDFGGERPAMPQDRTPPELPEGEILPGDFRGPNPQQEQPGEARTEFYTNDMVNCFSGVAVSE